MIFRRNKNKTAAPAAPAIPLTIPEEPVLSELDEAGVPRKKILVVDDDPLTLKVMSLRLKSRGFRVITASAAGEALCATRTERPDLMLLDVNLPPDLCGVDWNGFVVAQWLQRMNAGYNTPFIMMSGNDRAEYKVRSKDAGATAFIHKAADTDQLLASIDLALFGKKNAANPTQVFDI